MNNDQLEFDMSKVESCKYTLVVFQDPSVEGGLFTCPQCIPGVSEEAIGQHVRQQVRACEKGQVPAHNIGLVEFAIGTYDDSTAEITLFEKPIKLLRLYGKNEGTIDS